MNIWIALSLFATVLVALGIAGLAFKLGPDFRAGVRVRVWPLVGLFIILNIMVFLATAGR